jgi:hypothetical protein
MKMDFMLMPSPQTEEEKLLKGKSTTICPSTTEPQKYRASTRPFSPNTSTAAILKFRHGLVRRIGPAITGISG